MKRYSTTPAYEDGDTDMTGIHTSADEPRGDQTSLTPAPIKKRRGRKPKSEREATGTDPEAAYKDAVSAFLKARRQLAKWTAAYHAAESAVKAAESGLKVKR